MELERGIYASAGSSCSDPVGPRGTTRSCSVFLQEIAAYLISFDRHEEWLSYTLKTRYTPGCLPLCVSVLASNTILFLCQAKEWQHHPLQQEEGEVQERWIQLEEKERWKNDKRGSHEAESQGHGGEDSAPYTALIHVKQQRGVESKVYLSAFSACTDVMSIPPLCRHSTDDAIGCCRSLAHTHTHYKINLQ